MRNLLILSLLFVPPLVFTYAVFGLPLKDACEGNFTWLPTPTCAVTMGELLAREGISPIIDSSAAGVDCDDIQKGWCVTDENRANIKFVQSGEYYYGHATVTLKGVDVLKGLIR